MGLFEVEIVAGIGDRRPLYIRADVAHSVNSLDADRCALGQDQVGWQPQLTPLLPAFVREDRPHDRVNDGQVESWPPRAVPVLVPVRLGSPQRGVAAEEVSHRFVEVKAGRPAGDRVMQLKHFGSPPPPMSPSTITSVSTTPGCLAAVMNAVCAPID